MTPAPMTRWLRPALLAAALTAVPVSVSLAADDAATRKELEQARKELQAAREELARAAREMAKVARKADADSPRAEAYEFMLNPRRALLGVNLQTLNSHVTQFYTANVIPFPGDETRRFFDITRLKQRGR